MPTLEPDRKKPDNDNKAKTNYGVSSSNMGHTMPPRRFNFGEIQTLKDLATEFGEQQLTIKLVETGNRQIVDAKFDTPARMKFTDYLLNKLRDEQQRLCTVLPDFSEDVVSEDTE